MKKQADLSLNTIVVAAIVLIVLVVLVVIFAGRMGIFRGGLNSCSGACTTKLACSGENQIPVYTINCDDGQGTHTATENYCCMTRTP